MAKKGYVHRAKSFTIPVAPVVGILSMRGVSEAMKCLSYGDTNNAINWLKTIVGTNSAGKFQWSLFAENMTPLVTGMAVHYAASKLGVNRALGRAGVPVIRI